MWFHKGVARNPDFLKEILIIDFELEKTTLLTQSNPWGKGSPHLIHPLRAPGHVFQLPDLQEHHKLYETPAKLRSLHFLHKLQIGVASYSIK
jgi:hypothetical protein